MYGDNDAHDSPNGHDGSQELHHLQRMTSLRVEEIQSVLHLLHRDRILLRAVLQDQLLQEQERPLVWDLLPDLHQCLPCVLRRQLRAIRTLTVLYEVLDLEDLLENGGRQDFFLDGERDAETFRMRLRPDEMGFGEADFAEAFQLSQTDG